ncbi:hypothetical protein K1T71_003513 [Dendrolimus kikuchii]|uniref:Uncharacterized protein n=1 Tax=Dendrolimus kikuchii TaxID=765133 RepID=A0ACC1DBX2_9NEOP|nr:hypothetical protein K1T71_003513 [Dendrolimus kikuchii]
MSRDIRSFFQLKKPSKAIIPVEEDDDVIPESPDVEIKNKKKESRKRRIINDDSDEETLKSKKKSQQDAKAKSKPKSELKAIKPADLFGGPIKRTEPLVQKKKNTETGIHSDEEFEKSLLEIDSIDVVDFIGTPNHKEKSPIKPADIKNVTKDNTNKTALNRTSLNEESKLNKNNSNTKTTSNTFKDVNNVPRSDKLYGNSSCSQDIAKISKHDTKDPKSSKIEARKVVEEVRINNKRKFEEFLDTDNKDDVNKKAKVNNQVGDETVESDISMIINDHKKKKHNKSLNDSALTDEERHERKRYSAALYQKYLNRSGPKHLGAKQIPEGSSGCLKDCAFLLTGVLDSFEREEIIEAITKYGGSVKNSISKKVTHVLAGEDAGPAKMAKAQELGIKILNEDDFIKLIENNSKNHDKTKPAKDKTHKKDTSNKVKLEKDEKEVNSSAKNIKLSNNKESPIKEKQTPNISNKNKLNIKKESKHDNNNLNVSKIREKSKSPKKDKEENHDENHSTRKKTDNNSSEIKTNNYVSDIHQGINKINENNKPINASMWVEKYKPQNVKQIIGQTGEASNVKKLTNWLKMWYTNRKAKLPKPSPWAKNDDGGFYKAALLSGPPGVGKTTTVSLVCKELGFDLVEFNASDTRNKTLIKNQIGELLTTNSLSGYAKGVTGKQAVSKKHRGLQELINLIKSTSVPIICMCNDRNSQKMRSLVNYCYDLRFNKPRVDQIKSAMMSVCFKESLKIPPDVLSQLIVAANQDVRQTMNLLSMWAVEPNLAEPDKLRKDAKVTKKDIKLGPWEAVRKVFSAEDHKTMSINDKSDLFFYDYSLAPLFVQENYLLVQPNCAKKEMLQCLSKAADSISMGDLVDSRIRGSQAWSLLPLQAMYSSVIPGHALSGHVAGQIQFPGWLGKNSRANKMHRLCQEIHAHTRLSTTGSKSSIFLDYATHLRDAILNPLINDKTEGIDKSLEVLESYHLLREDLESLVELSLWPGQRNPTVLVDPKVKAAMTRTYNKKATALPYAPGAVKRGKAKDDDEMGVDEEQQQHEEDEAEDSDPEHDALIKKKKGKESEKGSSSKEKPSTSKGKASSIEKHSKGKRKK